VQQTLHSLAMTAPFLLADHHIEPGANEIDGTRVDSKAMAVLVCLAQVAPAVVSRSELLDRAWPNVIVGDNVLHQAITRLRKVLGDDARSPRYIENIPRRGYRLLVQMQVEAVSGAEPDRARSASRHDLGTFERRHVVLSGAVSPHRPADAEAYLRFLQARRELEQDSPGAMDRATRLLKEAVAIDPGCTCGWSEVARASAKAGNRDFAGLLAQRAVELDPSDRLANAWLGWTAMTQPLIGCDLERAAFYLGRALAADPTNHEVLHLTTVLLIRLGRLPEAIRVSTWSLSRDPVCVPCRLYLGQAHLAARRFLDAEQAFAVALALAPASVTARAYLVWSQLVQGSARAALSTLGNDSYSHPSYSWLRALCLRDLGDLDILPKTLETLEAEWGDQAYYLLAEGHAMMGDQDTAFTWLQQSALLPTADLTYPHLTVSLVALHDDPRWHTALERFGLLPEQRERIKLDIVLAGAEDPPVGRAV
jgi:DNA-binding winged helix-turn-helix (wHTH) protein/Flp pilus assembly protein TadD